MTTQAATRAISVTRATREGRMQRVYLALAHLVILAVGLVVVSPLIWTILTSIKPAGEIISWPPTILPSKPRWINYVELFQQTPFANWMRNSAFIALMTILGSVLSSTLVGYAFGRLRFAGRDQLFILCLSTMMLPGVVTLIPSFVMFRFLGWIDSFTPLILPAWFGTPFFVFLARQYFRTIPYEYEEAARVDGAGSWRIWWQIMLPMSRPVVGTIIIFAFLGAWNDFLHPLIYLYSEPNLTLAVGLRTLNSLYQRGGGATFMMVGSVLMTIPMLLVFFFAQRYFLQGIALSGLGGR